MHAIRSLINFILFYERKKTAELKLMSKAVRLIKAAKMPSVRCSEHPMDSGSLEIP
jgi:hypothetical protein